MSALFRSSAPLSLFSPRTFPAAARLFSASPLSRLAKLTIVGRLAAEPELFTASNGQEMVRYAVGTSSGTPENRQTSWWRVTSFDAPEKGRERLLGLSKGSLVYVEGNATMRKYEKDGRIENVLNLVQQKLEVLKKNDAATSEEVEVD